MPFIISSICCLVFAILFLKSFVGLIFAVGIELNYFAIAMGILGVLGGVGLTGKSRVFYHEFKHKLVSGLVGNRPKRLEIKSAVEGEFEYEYSTETKHFNPFIALAPYFFPFITLFSVPFWTFFQRADIIIREGILVFSLAFDLSFSATELDPYQSDFEAVPGGKFTGLLFVVSVNLILSIICLAVCLGGFSLLGQLLYEFFWATPRTLIIGYAAS